MQTCRRLKETLLGADAPERLTVNLPWSGSRLIGGGLQVEVTRQRSARPAGRGLLPRVPLDAKPAAAESGFQEFGLPYAPDPAVTRYLAAFLSAHRHVATDEDRDACRRPRSGPARHGALQRRGVRSPALRQRLLEVLQDWFANGAGGWQPVVLDNERLDLAVARGAAYYGMVRRGQGVRIAAGLARTLLHRRGIEGGRKRAAGRRKRAAGFIPADGRLPSAWCRPGSSRGTTSTSPSGSFELLVSEPVEFPLYVSSTRLTDRPGELVPLDREQMTPLPPIRTVLRTRKKGEAETISVQLHARLTEIGTLDLWCSEVGGRRSWRLQFDVRSATQTDIAAHETAAEGEGVRRRGRVAASAAR